jgi:hypothetical protein
MGIRAYPCVTEKDLDVLYYDWEEYTQDGVMTPWKWNLFIGLFGPIQRCFDKLLEAVRKGYDSAQHNTTRRSRIRLLTPLILSLFFVAGLKVVSGCDVSSRSSASPQQETFRHLHHSL